MEYKCLLPVSNLARLSPLMSSPLMPFAALSKTKFGCLILALERLMEGNGWLKSKDELSVTGEG